MDTNVLPKETQALHIELTEAQRKATKRDQRAVLTTGYGATVGGMALTYDYLGKVTEAVTSQLNGSRAKSNTIQFQFERVIRQLDVEVVALCVLQSGLNAVGGLGHIATHRDAVFLVGTALSDECFAAKLLQTDKKLAHKITKQVTERYGSLKLRKQAAVRAAEAAGFTMVEWTENMLAHAGQWGLNILLAAMPWVFELTEPEAQSKHHTERLWTLTESGMMDANKAMQEAVIRSPVYQPREERPLDWTSFYTRVAEDDRSIGNAPLLRTGHKDIIAASKQAIKSGQMAPALRAINVLQSVPFKINTWIMDVMNACYKNGIAVDGLPFNRALEVPKRLSAAQFEALSVEERRLLGKTIFGRKKANRTRIADLMQYDIDMATAARMSLVERFHTPMNMDWRGRVYSLTHFNFQREDRVRALFLFANGEPLGDDGIRWLKMHVANCGAFDKIDKKPIEERIKWVDDNLDVIAEYVQRPLYRTEWTQADSPFLFLAACRELVSAMAQGTDYVCHMPVSFDGSCSGLQHLAAMTLAPEGRYVNLTDNLTPEDVYQLVADHAKARIEADLESEDLFGKDDNARPVKQLAKIALAYGVDRKLVKRNVMTFAYSSKEYGMSEQLYEDTMEPLELKLLKGEITSHPFGETEEEWRRASRYLANRVLASIKEIVRLPAAAMAFMQVLAQKLAHEGKPLKWVSPAGIPCINRYHERTQERIKLWLNDKGVKSQLQMVIATGYEAPIAKEKAAAGIAPNFVHSHDAGHLLLTVVASASEGINDIATVHDSFGCLPSRATRFNQIIRETFLRMYSEHDVLSELLESARANLDNPDKLPELPTKGALDLTEILNARYAFA